MNNQLSLDVNDNIIRTEYSDIMKSSYINYAMSVIVSRALPDVRDGLKPVQRRTLYAMYELGLRYNRPYRKCARIVGDTMGKYHPHGDSSIYEALVVMAQEFKKGLPLVDGHGNFGSIEGDGAAAMRYTEARLTRVTQETYLEDLDKNIIDYGPNFDETEREPLILPVRIPNLLINGAEGIAVGMATSIPPHNLIEVIDAVKAYIQDTEVSTKQLLTYVKGPDFPTGGIVVNKNDLRSLYETGQGKVRIRGKVHVEDSKGGKKALVITEIPYTMVGNGIGRFLNDVANLVETKKTSDILDISNQTSKDGIRIVIELRKGADVENLTNMLYKKTRLEDTFGVNMLTVANGRPEILGLKAIIEHFVDFQFELTTRKYSTLLTKEEEKKEIQEGLIKACDIIDLIIEIIRGSQTIKDARECLTQGKIDAITFKSNISKRMAKLLHFTERQASAILELRLAKLIGLEILALQEEHEKTLANIARYTDILNNYESMSSLIIDELTSYQDTFGMKRKTVVMNAEEVVFEEKKIEEMEVVFLMDRFGYAKTIDLGTYERNMDACNTQYKYVVPCMNTSRINIFTESGRMHQVKVLDLPFAKMKDKGTPIDNVSNYVSSEEQMIYVCDQEQLRTGKFLFATAHGLIKIVDGEEFIANKRTIVATKLNELDQLVDMRLVNSTQQVVLQTSGGYFLRFSASDVPMKKKNAAGVRGIKLQKNDSLETVHVFNEGVEYKIPYGSKELSLNRLKLGHRDSVGTKNRSS